jgi:hypothetical protein
MAIVEVITFRLVPTAHRDEAIQADQQVQTEYVYRQPGIVRRTTAISDDGEWLVLQLWQSVHDADAAADGAARDLAAKRLQRLVDQATVHVARYDTLD